MKTAVLLLGLVLAACPDRPAALPPVIDAGVPAAPRVPAQAKPTPEWDADFFTVDVVAMVVRLRHVEVVSVGPVKDEDILPGLDAGTIPDTTRTVFSDGTSYTVVLHKVAKRPYIASLDLKGGLSVEQADENLDGHRDSVTESDNSGREVKWRASRPGGHFDTLVTQAVLSRDGDYLMYQVTRWKDPDGDGQWTFEKTFKMSNISH